MNPAIYEVPVRLKKDHEILALVNLITMTPGTLSLDLSKDKKKLYVHSMYTGNKKDFIQEIKELEKRIHRSFG